MVEHRILYRVPYGQVDRMGFLYHSHYLELFDMGRTELIRSLGISNLEMEQRGYELPVLKAEISYHMPAGYDDVLEIRTRISRMPSATITFEYEIYRRITPDSEKLEEKPITVGSVRLAFISAETKRAVRPPQFVTELLAPYF